MPGDFNGENVMKRSTVRNLRRGLLAAALTGGAAVGVGTVSASAAGGTVAPHVANCATSQLKVWIGLPNGVAMGTYYFELELSNTGTTTCRLYGYPGVSALDGNGAQLGSPAGWDPSVTPATVVLTPGATSHVLLMVADVHNYPAGVCQPAAANALRIYPPNQTAAVQLPFGFDACSKTGPVYLHVRPVTAGVGIPGYSD
jgi:hypothetical protein